MRILFSYGLVGRGGDAIQVQALAEAWRNLGHEVYLVGPHPLQPYEFGSVKGHMRSLLRRLPWWVKDFIELGLQWRLGHAARCRLDQKTFDLIFYRAGIYDSVGAQLAECCPLIAHLDAPFAVERSFRSEGYFERLHRRSMRQLGQAARLVVTISAASRDYYVQLGIPTEKILIVPNGISSQLLQRGAELTRASPPLADPRQCTLGFVGSLSRWHRMDLLLEALRLLCQQDEGAWQLQIVGYGGEYARLRRLAEELDLGSHVEWLGPLPHNRAFEQIAQFDIAVLPHTLSTGAPLKLFEYAAVARPIIAPDLPNLRELFTDEEMCFVRPRSPEALGEAVMALRSKPEIARQLGQRAQARVGLYTWERGIMRILETVDAD